MFQSRTNFKRVKQQIFFIKFMEVETFYLVFNKHFFLRCQSEFNSKIKFINLKENTNATNNCNSLLGLKR